MKYNMNMRHLGLILGVSGVSGVIFWQAHKKFSHLLNSDPASVKINSPGLITNKPRPAIKTPTPTTPCNTSVEELFPAEKIRKEQIVQVADVNKYLKDGGDVNALDKNGNPLIRSVYKFIKSKLISEDAVMLLLTSGMNPWIDVNANDKEDLLYYACQMKMKDVIFKLLEMNPEKINTQYKGFVNETPLYIVLGNNVDTKFYNKNGNRDLAIEIAKNLLKFKPDLEISSQNGNILSAAASLGDKELVQQLLDSGIDANMRSENGKNALFHTIHEEQNCIDEAMFTLLLDKDVDPLARMSQYPYYTIIQQLIRFNGINQIKQIADKYPTLLLDVESGPRFLQPLSQAVIYNNLEIAKFILSLKENIDETDIGGFTPLMHAAVEKSIPMAKLFLQNSTDVKCDVNKKSEGGISPLMVACHFGHLEIVDLFMQHGADVNNKSKSLADLSARNLERSLGIFQESDDYWLGLNAFMVCAKHGHLDIAKLLYDKYGFRDINATNDAGETALHLCIKKNPDNCLEMVKYLISLGADPKLETRNLVKSEHRETERLMRHRAPGRNALMMCAIKNNWIDQDSDEIAKLLLRSYKWDINKKDANGNTALMLCCQFGSFDTAKVLLEAGADPEIKNNAGQSVIEYTKRYPELLKIVQDYQGSVNYVYHRARRAASYCRPKFLG